MDKCKLDAQLTKDIISVFLMQNQDISINKAAAEACKGSITKSEISLLARFLRTDGVRTKPTFEAVAVELAKHINLVRLKECFEQVSSYVASLQADTIEKAAKAYIVHWYGLDGSWQQDVENATNESKEKNGKFYFKSNLTGDNGINVIFHNFGYVTDCTTADINMTIGTSAVKEKNACIFISVLDPAIFSSTSEELYRMFSSCYADIDALPSFSLLLCDANSGVVVQENCYGIPLQNRLKRAEL